jgi:AraC-like DNA-binding protein
LAPLSLLPQKLGCHKRTLERSLREVGLTAQALRRADRMMRVAAGLFAGDSLTSIAADCGFSDTAHMSRSFRAACGFAPRMLVDIARDDTAGDGYVSRLPYRRPHAGMRPPSNFDEL